MRRYNGNMNGEKFLGNKHTIEVHDLDNEKPICQINEIINANHDLPFNFLFEAKNAGFDNCAFCLGNSNK